MTNKYVKLFEQYSEEYDNERDLLDSLYEDWKIENEDLYDLVEYEDVYEDDEEMDDWEEDDSELTSGEKAALARDFQILSKPQMAALFLKALDKMDEDPGKYLVMIEGITPFGKMDETKMSFNITNPGLADAIGLNSVRTVARTVNKFYNLLTGEGETSGESIYPKLLKAYREFNQRTPREIAMLASEALQDPETSVKHREADAMSGVNSAADRLRRKQEQLKIGEKVYSLTQTLRRIPTFQIPGKAESAAISKLAREMNMDPSKVSMAYSKFLKDKGISRIK